MGWNYLSIPKIQRRSRWDLGMASKFALHFITLIARLMGPTWGPSGADRTQVGPMLAPWTLLSGYPCDYLSMRGLNFIHVCKMSPGHDSKDVLVGVWHAITLIRLSASRFCLRKNNATRVVRHEPTICPIRQHTCLLVFPYSDCALFLSWFIY